MRPTESTDICTLASGKSGLEQSIIIKRAGLRNPINLWDVCLVVILNLRSYSKSLFSLCLQQFPDKFIIRSPLLSKQFSWSLQQSSRPISLILYLPLRKKMSLLRCYAVDKEEVEVTTLHFSNAQQNQYHTANHMPCLNIGCNVLLITNLNINE